MRRDRGNACVLEGCVDYPPFNIVAPAYSKPYGSCFARMNASPSCGCRIRRRETRVLPCPLGFDRQIGQHHDAVGTSGLPILMDTFLRLTKSPVISTRRSEAVVGVVSMRVSPRLRYAFLRRRGENTRLGQTRSRGGDCIKVVAGTNASNIMVAARVGRLKSSRRERLDGDTRTGC